VLGDLEEEFADRAAGDLVAARRWYWRQVIRSAAPNFWRRVRHSPRPLRWALMWTLFSFRYVIEGLLQRRDVYSLWYTPAVWCLIAAMMALPVPQVRTKFQVRLLAILCVLGLGPATALGASSPTPERLMIAKFVLTPILLLFIALRFWPRWPRDAAPAIPPPTEFQVRWQPPGELAPWKWTWLTIVVPNTPLGVSGLVLSRAAAEPRAWVRAQEPVIDRTFHATDTLAINAAIHVDRAPIVARLDVLDRDGRLVRSVTPAITLDRLQVQPGPGTEQLSDADMRIAAVGATLPLAGLAAGDYELSLTLMGATGTAHRSERIHVMTG